MAVKTNAMRLLDQLGIRYEVREYSVDESDLSAESVAAKIGMPEEQVFKTLVTRGDVAGITMAVIPANTELDLKTLARATGDRKIEPVALKEVLPLTGYIRGGVTVLAAKKDYPVFVDELAQLYDAISVSPGQRGLQIILNPLDYLRASNGKFVAISRFK